MSAPTFNPKIILAGLALVLLPTVGWSPPESVIAQANQLYKQNQFREAAELYEQVIAGGMENGHLYYNLGNVYFRMGDLAGAILNYVKAQNLLPRDEDIEANLEYALRQTVDQLDGRTPHALNSVLFWVRDLSLKEHGTALLWINLGFWIALALRLHHKTRSSHTAMNFLLAILVLAVVSTGFRWQQETGTSIGVVLPKQINVHSGWNAGTVALFQLHQGAIVTLAREKEQWVELKLPDGKSGWTPKSNITRERGGT